QRTAFTKPPGQQLIGFPDPQGLAIHPVTRDFYCIGSLAGSSAKGVYRIDASGTPQVYAGSANAAGGNGDGGPALQRKFFAPQNLVFDSNGNLLIVDAGSPRANGLAGNIRIIDSGGMISTLAGNLTYPVGIVIQPGSNAVYVAVGNGQQIVRVRSGGASEPIAGIFRSQCNANIANWVCGDGGDAIKATFNLPTSVDNKNLTLAADTSGLFVPDFGSKAIRYINLGGAATGVAGTTIQGRGIDMVVGQKQLPPYDHGPAASATLKY